VEDEMARAGFDRAHIAGNSLGGWVALELARRGRAETVTAVSPAGLQHGREREWGVAILREIRWMAQKAPPPRFLMRNPAGRILAAGPSYMRAWKKDPDHLAEEAELFATNPGFEATLPHTVHAQPRGLTTLDVPVLILWPSFSTSAASATRRCRTRPTCSPRRSPSSLCGLVRQDRHAVPNRP
jgi:pimeloyl-ACP methyl ester carboxylesterase